MFKRSIVRASHKISAKNIDHCLAEMEWRFTNRNNQDIVQDTLVRILPLGWSGFSRQSVARAINRPRRGAARPNVESRSFSA